jgi:Fic family protein
MDKGKFIDNSPGRLKKIDISGHKDWAFVPDTLPVEWKIPIDVWPLMAEAREELARLDGTGRHMPNYELLLQPLQKREALRSSSLEGTYATPEQLLFFEIDPKEPKSHRDPVNAWKEVSNYSQAMRLGQELLTELPISLRLIRNLHEKLLSGVRGHQRNPGNFRKSQVHIGSDRRFIPPPSGEMMQCLYDLEQHIHQESNIDPLIYCFMVHYQFETIHPFLDGNGRVGRLLLSLMIYKMLNLRCPWLYLSAYFEKYKDEYINNLFNVSSKGDWTSWIVFCLRGVVAQSKDAIERFDKMLELQIHYHQIIHDKGGNVRLIKIVDDLFESPVVTIPYLAMKHGVSKQTARNDIHYLADNDILTRTDFSKIPITFLAPDIIKIAYSDEIE